MSEARASSQPGIGYYHRRLLQGLVGEPVFYQLLAGASSALAAVIYLTVNTGADPDFVAETVGPLLAAFLAAFCLAPEYRGRALDLLAYRPAFRTRLVLSRALAVMLFSLGLIGVTLAASPAFVMLTAVPMALLVAFPSVWALSLLSLTVATRFRSPWTGFAAAFGVWLLNVTLGYGVHPLLGLQGHFASQDNEPAGKLWLLGKLLLLVVGVLLLKLHAGYAARRSGPDLFRAAAAIGVLLVLYTVSGAGVIVAMAALDRTPSYVSLPWLRARMQPLQAVGIPRLFGPAFAVYLASGSVRPGIEAGLEQRSRAEQLEQAAARWPRSVWAGRISLEAAHLREGADRNAAVRAYLELADRHPRSGIALAALDRVLTLSGATLHNQAAAYPQFAPPSAFTAARKIVAEYPNTSSARVAQHFLETHFE